MVYFGLGALTWTAAFFRSFGTFTTFDGIRLVGTVMGLGLVLMLAGVFAVGVKAVRRLDAAAERST